MEGVGYATGILVNAVKFDSDGRFTEAKALYESGLQILVESLSGISDENTKAKLRSKITEYMDRAEKLKKHIDVLKAGGKYREQIQIEENSVGHSYDSLFGRFLDNTVTKVEIDDAYIRSPHQCDNFIRFLELVVKKCSNLKHVHLNTGRDEQNTEAQRQRLDSIMNSVRRFNKRNITLTVDYSDSLHDRAISLDNGWCIKVGRGLDFYKPVDRFTLGFSDFDLRLCKSTSVDIFHRKELVKRPSSTS